MEKERENKECMWGEWGRRSQHILFCNDLLLTWTLSCFLEDSLLPSQLAAIENEGSPLNYSRMIEGLDPSIARPTVRRASGFARSISMASMAFSPWSQPALPLFFSISSSSFSARHYRRLLQRSNMPFLSSFSCKFHKSGIGMLQKATIFYYISVETLLNWCDWWIVWRRQAYSTHVNRPLPTISFIICIKKFMSFNSDRDANQCCLHNWRECDRIVWIIRPCWPYAVGLDNARRLCFCLVEKELPWTGLRIKKIQVIV